MGDHMVKHGSWSYANPLPDVPAIKGYLAFS
jgi:uncharacterized protein (DUF427 family)